jgi:hypothetical protein
LGSTNWRETFCPWNNYSYNQEIDENQYGLIKLVSSCSGVCRSEELYESMAQTCSREPLELQLDTPRAKF